MMRLIRSLFQRFPPAQPHRNEALLRERIAELDRELAMVERQNRQRDTIYLLEQEVDAVTVRQRRARKAT